MDRKHFLLVIILAAVSGLVGGVVGRWFIVGDSAFAQKEHQQQIITADEFRLLDKDGKIRAKLAVFDFDGGGEPKLVFFDKSSKPRVILGVSPGLDKAVLDEIGLSDKHRELFVGESAALSFLDSNGTGRAIIALRSDGSPYLSFHGNEAFGPFTTHLELKLDTNEGPALELWDDSKPPKNMTEKQRLKKGVTPRAFFGLSVDGEPKMSLSDKDGNSGIDLFVSTDGYRGLQVHDKDDKWRVELAVLKDDTPVLNFFNKNDKQLLALGLDRDEVPSMLFSDKQNIIRAGLGLEKDNGSPFLRLVDENDNIRLSLGSTPLIDTRTGSNVKRPASSLVLFDKDAKVIWSAP